MLREMTSQQVDEWIAFYRIEPFGLAVWDNLCAHFKALFAAANTPKGKPREKLEKFLLWPDKPKQVDATFERGD